MTPPDPRDSVSNNEAIGNSDIVVASAEPLIPDAKGAASETELRNGNATGAGDAKSLVPVLARHADSLAGVIEAIKTNSQVVQKSCANGLVPAKAKVMRKARFEEV